jgi:hypothetical protein
VHWPNSAHGFSLSARRPADGARGGLAGSRPTVEVARPASVWPVAEAAQRARPTRWRSQRWLAGGRGTARSAAQAPSLNGEGTGKRKRGGAHPSGGST